MNKYPIEQVVPHGHPMILVDELISYTPSSASCSVEIRTDSNFYNSEKKSIPAYVGLEYLAQTIAAYANALKVDEGGEVALGFLVSARNYVSNVAEFSLGTILTTTVTKLFKEDNGLSVFECCIHAGQKNWLRQKSMFMNQKTPVFI
ncbi:3-hydroxylacyl-ACP dehydratase [Paraglaciecola aquimarina]|uniref:3-hydroxylacyl-ACP dehydratase n=1 Tax=Paraglaciecola aquimarina TaxID=1235557 RepID=A0ABU3SSQ8_9ALTE|nr:3-hydroxylacyl-ACP dehydratase [Paraglaciecola aquimarina]MDU0353048.1 3-hydroxylacyl-ACP dehydratase [Paraglaciecola aquimarina]